MRILISVILLISTPAWAQTDGLDRLVGRRLHKDPEGQAALRTIVDGDHWYGATPWYVWRELGGGYIALGGCRLWTIPGYSSATVHRLDSDGVRTSTWDFDVAYRGDIVDASYELTPKLGESAVVIQTKAAIGGSPANTQYYCFCDGKLALVWIEEQPGKGIQNRHSAPNFTIGPKFVAQGDAGLRKLLHSARVAEQLAHFAHQIEPAARPEGGSATLGDRLRRSIASRSRSACSRGL